MKNKNQDSVNEEKTEKEIPSAASLHPFWRTNLAVSVIEALWIGITLLFAVIAIIFSAQQEYSNVEKVFFLIFILIFGISGLRAKKWFELRAWQKAQHALIKEKREKKKLPKHRKDYR